MLSIENILAPDILLLTPESTWGNISSSYDWNEQSCLEQLISLADPGPEALQKCTLEASELIKKLRSNQHAEHPVDALLREYSLETEEGVLLMCLAEALIRIPDTQTADELIRDKLSSANWKNHLAKSDSFFVNASTWGLLISGKIMHLDSEKMDVPNSYINRLIHRLSEPVVRKIMTQAMRIMGHQFVLGQTIADALKRGQKEKENGYFHSFDMLGESATTSKDAERYRQAYLSAIKEIGLHGKNNGDAEVNRPTISIKLSALHPRYDEFQRERVLTELKNSILSLIETARPLNVGITIDAEEADRLELSLELFALVYQHKLCRGWGNFGLVVQAYSKRALPALVWLATLSHEQGDKIPLRLVKGAYWDSEIKWCQQNGTRDYPVFTRKEATDVSYLACARFLLQSHMKPIFYPQFATHNAQTVASVCLMATHSEFEFQRLHGMGEALYEATRARFGSQVRIYAPTGRHKDLLPYLVRRLLENGANNSFVHRLNNARCPIPTLVQNPVTVLQKHKSYRNQNIPLPRNILLPERASSQGINLHITDQRQHMENALENFAQACWHKGPIISGIKYYPDTTSQSGDTIVNTPYNHQQEVGIYRQASSPQVELALSAASQAFKDWSQCPVSERADCLIRFAKLLQQHQSELITLCQREAGKCIQDCIDEITEAIDFCYYYTAQARLLFSETPIRTKWNEQSGTEKRTGRGVFVCISPWNFPLAIFTGQVVAALVAGNTVIAKPAEQTSLIAIRAIELLLESGIPETVIHVLPGAGRTLGAELTRDERVAGVAFTGSINTAREIRKTLASRSIWSPLIAETGGQNTMIVDSTALPEQVIHDVIQSAFNSAGQRCSALRVLFLQEEIADHILEMIQGAMQELIIGNPCHFHTDVGPVIDQQAMNRLNNHINWLDKHARLIARTSSQTPLNTGFFVPPVAYELEDFSQLQEEHFGPILHVIRYQSQNLEQVINAINHSGYGLTMGVHSRIESRIRFIEKKTRVGNLYINRNQVGARVGVQPFGGRGLSGTGPKAGGPHYLRQFSLVHYPKDVDQTPKPPLLEDQG